MFWKKSRARFRSLTLRLSLAYAVIFTGSALVLFVLIYYLLGAAINQKDEDMVESRLREYQAVYQGGGVQALHDWVYRVDEAHRQQTFFVRVVKPDQTVLLVILPSDWIKTDVQNVEHGSELQPSSWIRIPRDDNVDLTVASTHLPDGTFMQVGRSSDSRAQLLGKFRKVFALITVPVIVLGFLGGMWMTSRSTRPLHEIVQAVRSIVRTGQLNVRVPASKTSGELEDMVELFNRMLQGNENLVLALRGSLDNVAHDLRTPLSRLRAGLEDALRTQADLPASRQAIAGALEETDRVQTIMRTLMDVTLAETGMMKLEIETTDLNGLVRDVIELYEDVAAEKQIKIDTKFEVTARAPVDPARIRQVFANLLDNALKYTPQDGHILIATHSDQDRIEISFQDNGPGIPEKDLPRIWERLYRGDQSRSEHGLGLGLSLVKAIVEAHGGRVVAEKRPSAGTEFRVILPLK
jgi:heavy metal sensor kinase